LENIDTEHKTMADDQSQSACRRRTIQPLENTTVDPDCDLRDTLFQGKYSDSADEAAEEVGLFIFNCFVSCIYVLLYADFYTSEVSHFIYVQWMTF